MLIEQKTSYAYKLKYLENPTFDKVRGFAKSFIDDLPKELVDELYSQLDRGVVQIDSEPQMLVYLYAFGNMHQAKLNKAFENIPELFFDLPDINIIDYGCGQAIGTMCYVDFIGVSQNVKRVTLIEPSEICLKRAALHVSTFCPDAEIVTVNKEFDDLLEDDINCEEDVPTLHILSNVLDLLVFDLGRFAGVISKKLKGYNQFVCVSPFFGFVSKDDRMKDFFSLLKAKENYSSYFDKFELNAKKEWTAQIMCFSVGELEEALTTKVTWDEIKNGVTDEFGVVYSRDGKRVLSGKRNLKIYIIRNGTQVICNQVFMGCESLQQITIPNSVKRIGNDAFSGCYSLHQIFIPNSVTSIGALAFFCCESLQQIAIPNSVTRIGCSAFYGCKSLKQITIPNSVTSIGYSTFDSCSSLQQVIIPNSVTSICKRAFDGCESLQQITIPNSVMSIGYEAFAHCFSLQQITIPNSVTSIGYRAFYKCKSLQEITIPNSVTRIGDLAFAYCSSLQHITIPNSVTRIFGNPFVKCSSLTLESQSSRFIVENGLLIDRKEQTVISYIGDNDSIAIPNSVTSIGDSAFDGCNFLQKIIIPNSVTSIGNSVFSGCESLQEITIPNLVTSIGKWAFCACSSLLRVTIPNSVTSIGDSAFAHCSSLQQITIPNSVTSIGDSAFGGCESLREITIPNSVTSIGEAVFDGCNFLQQIIIHEGSEIKFQKMLPKKLWHQLYYLKNEVAVKLLEWDDLPF